MISIDRQIGQPFNPWRRFNGVFVPLGLLAYPGLSDSAKLLYGRLGLYAGKDGESYAGRDELAKEMGLHKATITRLLNELATAGFIRRIRRGPGRKALCEFLYHDALISSEKSPTEDARMRHQDSDTEDAKVRHQEPQLRTQKCASEDAEVQHLDVLSTLADRRIRLPD